MKAEKKEQTVQMKFFEDTFVNGQCVYQKDSTHPIPVASKDRWLKRGAKLVSDTPEEEAVIAKLDSELAHDLEDQGKISHEEVVDADAKAEEAEEELSGEDADLFEEEEDVTTGKKTKKKKKKSSKN